MRFPALAAADSSQIPIYILVIPGIEKNAKLVRLFPERACGTQLGQQKTKRLDGKTS